MPCRSCCEIPAAHPFFDGQTDQSGQPRGELMYVPAQFALEDAELRQLLTDHGAADLVTATPHGLVATLVPFVYDPDVGEHGALLGHLARNNDQWRREVLGEAMVIVRGPDAYACHRPGTPRRNSMGEWSRPGTT